MNTIERDQAEQPTKNMPATTVTPLAPMADVSLLEAAASPLVGSEDRWVDGRITSVDRQQVPQRQQQSLQQQIFLTILPFMLLPLGLGGWLMMNNHDSRPVPGSPEIAQTEAAAKRLTETIVLLSIGFVNLGVGMWISRRLTASIDRVTTKLSEAASGNLAVTLAPEDNAEFQALADNFNQLVANFDRTLQQQQVAAQANKLFGKIALTAQESVDRQQVYNLGASGIRKILKADRVSIVRCNPDSSAVVIAESLDKNYPSTLSTPVGRLYFVDAPLELAGYEQGQNVAIADLQQVALSNRQRELLASMQVKSLVTIPILAGKQLVGLLSIHQCDRVRHWQDWEVNFGVQAAQRIGLAVEQIGTWNAQAIELRRTNMLSQALQVQELPQSIELLDRAVETIRQEFNLDRLLVLDSSARSSDGKIVVAATKPEFVLPAAVAMERYIDYELHRDGCVPEQISCIYNLDEAGGLNAEEIAALEQLQIRARTVAPIAVEGQLLGAIVGHMCVEDRHWTPAEIDKFATVADRIGLVLSRRKSIAQQAGQVHYRSLLAELTLQLRQSLDRDEIIATALTAIRTNFKLDRAVFVTCHDNLPLTIAAESLAPGSLSILGRVIDVALLTPQQLAGYGNGRTIALSDIDRAGLTAEQIGLLQQLQVRATTIMPILVNNQLFGLIVGDMCHAPRTWEPTLIEAFEQIATQLGLALNQAQLFAQREQEARRSQILSNFTLQLRQSLNRQDILSAAVELVRTALDLDRAVIFELDREFNGRITAESVVESQLAIMGVQIEDCCLKEAGYAQGKMTAFSDIYQANLSECHIQMLERIHVRANLVVPITIDSQLMGLLIGHECHQPRDWQPDEINLFNRLA
ncbi:GAF domain-containing protein, partial [Chamaesiphon sp. VAR_69_metabat_338]|uniref:GAF domain-containing protein n=1 Tax=Chamaesiphon sp. VAR_69_metabat_338 TaxID=2964704 RepID=UPI00286D80BD